MEKIVIRTDQTESSVHLLSIINWLFPECEKHIVLDEETSESRGGADWFRNEFQEERDG